MTDSEIRISRYELKYRVSFQEYLKLRNAIQLYMRKDAFTQRASGSGYRVRSLYFDTEDYASYHEKMDGNNERVKLRIRTYQEHYEDQNRIRVELKIRKSNLVIKKSTFVTGAEYLHFTRTNHWSRENDPVLTEFERYLHGKLQKPKVLIEYFREGYETRLGNGLRVTFDHEVKSAHGRELFPGMFFPRAHARNQVIVEIKFQEKLPHWIRHLVHQHGLRITANSKFTQAIQAARHDLHHPGGVVVIR